MWLIPDDKSYQPAEKVLFHDKIWAATILKLFPAAVKPNHLTMFRFLATPLVVLFVYYGYYQIGLGAFIIVALTDTWDGSLARTRNQITEWGKTYDSLADRILIGAMIFTIVLRYIDFWAAMLIIGLEIVVVPAAWWHRHRGMEVKANVWGKIKMVLQVVGVAGLLLAIVFNIEALLPFSKGVFYLAIAFSVMSLWAHGT